MIVDLSVRLNEQTPVYPGDPTVKINPAGVLKRDGYQDHHISFGTHLGTHVDAPAHMITEGKTLDQIPAEHFVGNGKIINPTGGFDFETIKQAGIAAGDIVLFETGLSKQYQKPSYFENYPAMSEEMANYLVEQKVKMVGVDTCSVDNTNGFPIHKILLAGDVLIIENLTNLSKLTGKEFKVYSLPLNLELDGSPARVIAEIN